jgi:integrase
MTGEQLTRQMECYLSLKQALGYRMPAQERQLRDFVKSVISKGDPCDLTSRYALDWACVSGSPSSRATRLRLARQFLLHLSATQSNIEIPPKGLLIRPRRRRPFLFSPEQVTELIGAASLLGPEGSLRPRTFSTLIGLLASTGLRPSEALKLTVADVGLDQLPPRLLVRESKFRKSRLVPLHSSVAEKLAAYAEVRRRLAYDGLSDAFFVSEQGGHVHYMALCRVFQRLVETLGTTAESTSTRRPTLNSFRHGFAVERLRVWCQEGIDVRAWMPRLSVYLGHVDPSNTYWYLSSTPELLLTASASFLKHFHSRGAQ